MFDLRGVLVLSGLEVSHHGNGRSRSDPLKVYLLLSSFGLGDYSGRVYLVDNGGARRKSIDFTATFGDSTDLLAVDVDPGRLALKSNLELFCLKCGS